jgi:hypothetical protein
MATECKTEVKGCSASWGCNNSRVPRTAPSGPDHVPLVEVALPSLIRVSSRHIDAVDAIAHPDHGVDDVGFAGDRGKVD